MPATKTANPPLRIDRDSSVPLSSQIVTQIRELADSGVLRSGDELASTRALAARLGVSRGTIVTAFDQLQAEGYLVASHGSGTRIGAIQPSPHQQTIVPRSATDQHRGIRWDLRPGVPDVTTIDSAAWRSAWRHGITQLDTDIEPLGLPRLRNEISEHLRLMRSVVRPGSQIAVTAGAREGLSMLLSAIARQDGPAPVVGIERPGHPALSGVPDALGLATVGLRTDSHGLVTSELPLGSRRPDVVVVTPSHQYPYGGSLPIGRRQELLSWARRTGALIVEDDYDSELRHVGMPLPALAALDDPRDGRVVLLGTFSTVLTPAVATGYLALPHSLVAGVEEYRAQAGLPSSQIVQQGLANYLVSGALRRHIQQMRRLYRRRRRAVIQVFQQIPGVQLMPLAGGVQAVVLTQIPGSAIVDAAATRGILVSDLARYWGPESQRSERGIVFGFACLPDDRIGQILGELGECCRGDANETPDQAKHS